MQLLSCDFLKEDIRLSGTVNKNTDKWDFVFAIKDPMTGKRK